MVAADMTRWADKWALKFGRDVETFRKKVEKMDIPAMTHTEIAQAFDIPEKKASYLKRGYLKFGRPRNKHTITFERSSGVGVQGVPIKSVEKMYTRYQRLLQREIEVEEEKRQIEREKERFKHLAVAFKALQEAAGKVVKEEEREVSHLRSVGN